MSGILSGLLITLSVWIFCILAGWIEGFMPHDLIYQKEYPCDGRLGFGLIIWVLLVSWIWATIYWVGPL